MLPVFGRPLKAKPDTQSSENGVVATNRHLFTSSSSVERNVWLLGDPDAMKRIHPGKHTLLRERCAC
jgi:hypothetical protein